MSGFIVLDRDWNVVQQKELPTFAEASALVERTAKAQRNGPYRILQVVGYGRLIPESVQVETTDPSRVDSDYALAGGGKKTGGKQ